MIHQGKRQEAAKEKMASGKGCCCCCWRFIAAWLPSSSSSSCSAASASPFFFFFFFFTISYLPLLRVLLGRGTNLRSLRRRRRQELRATRCTRRFSFRYSEGGGGGVHCLRHQRGFCSITTLGSIIPSTSNSCCGDSRKVCSRNSHRRHDACNSNHRSHFFSLLLSLCLCLSRARSFDR
jgi:hypothetical protein